MTEKIIVSPVRVRALGDVVSPKSSQDFVPYGCTVSSSTDSTYGTVFTEAYLAKSTLSLVYDRWISSDAESFTIGATLKNSSGSAISGASVYLVVNDGSPVSATTNSSGVATFTVSTSDVTDYKFRVYYTGTGSVCGSTVYGHVCVGDVTGLELHGNKSVIQTDESVGLWVSLTGTGCLKGVPVSFYEQWTPVLRVGANPSIIQTGDTTDLSAQLCDSDGSLIRESGHSIEFYQQATNGVLFSKNTEQTFTSESTKVFDSISGHLLNFADADWTLEFDLKNGNNGNGGLNIGATSEFTPPSTANYRLFIGTDVSKFSFNNRTNSSSNTKVGARDIDTYYHMKMVKSGDSVSAYYDGTLIATETVDWLENYSSFDVYFISWGGTTYVKNIVLKINGE